MLNNQSNKNFVNKNTLNKKFRQLRFEYTQWKGPLPVWFKIIFRCNKKILPEERNFIFYFFIFYFYFLFIFIVAMLAENVGLQIEAIWSYPLTPNCRTHTAISIRNTSRWLILQKPGESPVFYAPVSS